MFKIKNQLISANSLSTAGFTLIELLVVIAIIGMLASIALVSLNNSRVKARDARRIADIRQIQTALELYFNDNNSYPSYVTCDSISTTCWPVLLSPYIAAMPIDPLNLVYAGSGVGGYEYSYMSGQKPNGCSTQTATGSTQNYVLMARLENYASSPYGCAASFSNLSDNGAVNYIVGR